MFTTVPSASVMVMVTELPGATSSVVPDRSTVSLVSSTLSTERLRVPAVTSSVPVPESDTGLSLRSVAEAFTVTVPSTRLDTSTPGTE